MKKSLSILPWIVLFLGCGHGAFALTINADFSRNITPLNPGTNPASLLYVGTGPAPDTCTLWNDLQVPLSNTGDLPTTPSIDHPVTFSNLNASTGAATTIDIQLTTNFYRAFNSPTGTVNNLQRDWVFANGNLQATLTIQGLDPSMQYDLFLIGTSFATTFTVNGVGKTANGATDGTWTSGGEYVSFTALTPTAGGEIVVLIHGSGQVNGTIAGLQIVEVPYISSFTSSAPFVQRPATPTLSWSVVGAITSLTISPGVGDVLPLTTGGSGSVAVSPLGEQTYTLTLNGSVQQTVSVVGLPSKEKLHLYLLIGQSNMQGAGTPFGATADAPHPRVVKFGSRNSMEPIFVKGGHNLTLFDTTNSNVGMGVEFGKTMLAAQSDPEVVIGLINHALGSSAIQWWAPGVIDNKQINPVTGLNYYLYDEAIQRVNAALDYGVLKGVLWHQGEYNCGSSTDPDWDSAGYAARLQALVTNLRNSCGKPDLPFVCGKFVPATWTYADGSAGAFTGLPYRATVEGALVDLPNHRTNAACVDNDGLRGRSDQLIHFDSYSQRILGQRYAAEMIGMYSNPFRLYFGGFYDPVVLADPQTTAPTGDNDHDGIGNYLEYAFLTNPAQRQGIVPVSYAAVTIPGQGTFPALVFRQRMDSEAPRYVVEVSDDLVHWERNTEGQPAVTATVGAPVDNGDGTWTTTVRQVAPLAGSGGGGFLRLRVVGLP